MGAKLKEVIHRECNTCNTQYRIYRKNQKFCSHACKSQSVKDSRETPKCRACHKVLIGLPRGARYCNHDCYLEGQKNRNGRICKNCGTTFGSQLVNDTNTIFVKATNKVIAKDIYCSMECTAAGNRGSKNIGWKGGTTIGNRSKEVMVLIQSSNCTLGVRDKYRARKRLVTEAVLNRKLQKTECVLHIDGNPTNDAISNLYICDLGTIRKFNKHTIKITQSNLYNYDKGEV
tara:strand:+ start:642 stop:1334 length:693 start_codon:yes stop_codon:yes gene_type:complete